MIDSRERGFTLVELVIATAITGLIVSFLGTGAYQMLTITEQGNNRLTAMHELQNAACWFSIDGQGANSGTGGSGLVLTLSDNSTVTYSLAGTELRRTLAGAQMTLARNISSANFSIAGRVITMSLTSSPAGRQDASESGTYKVYLRTSEGGG
jgi:prepilin-type N-terminal cleavage/methylation domain-containing protein